MEDKHLLHLLRKATQAMYDIAWDEAPSEPQRERLALALDDLLQYLNLIAN